MQNLEVKIQSQKKQLALQDQYRKKKKQLLVNKFTDILSQHKVMQCCNTSQNFQLKLTANFYHLSSPSTGGCFFFYLFFWFCFCHHPPHPKCCLQAHLPPKSVDSFCFFPLFRGILSDTSRNIFSVLEGSEIYRNSFVQVGSCRKRHHS